MPSMPSVPVNEKGQEGKRFCNTRAGDSSTHVRLSPGQHFLFEAKENLVQKHEHNRNVSDHFSQIHQRVLSEFSHKLRLYSASIRQGSVYVKCFFPATSTLTFSSTSEKRDHNCKTFYRSA